MEWWFVKNHFFYNHDIKYSEGILSVHYLIKKLTERFAPPYFRTQEGSRKSTYFEEGQLT